MLVVKVKAIFRLCFDQVEHMKGPCGKAEVGDLILLWDALPTPLPSLKEFSHYGYCPHCNSIALLRKLSPQCPACKGMLTSRFVQYLEQEAERTKDVMEIDLLLAEKEERRQPMYENASMSTRQSQPHIHSNLL